MHGRPPAWAFQAMLVHAGPLQPAMHQPGRRHRQAHQGRQQYRCKASQQAEWLTGMWLKPRSCTSLLRMVAR